MQPDILVEKNQQEEKLKKKEGKTVTNNLT